MRRPELVLTILSALLCGTPALRAQDAPPVQPPPPVTAPTIPTPAPPNPSIPTAPAVDGSPHTTSITAPAGATNASAAPSAKANIKTNATPALWMVKGTHATIYLFGSFHILRKGIHWENPIVKKAFDSSGVIYFEIPDIDMTSQMQELPTIMSLGMDKDHPLSTKISKEDVALLDVAAKKVGLGGEVAFEAMQPWLADMVLSILPAMNAGYDATAGIEETLFAQAKAAKKPVKGFETAAGQMAILAGAPMDEQVASLHKSLIDKSDTVGQIDIMLGDWTRGDVEKIADMENGDLKKNPALYNRLLVKRNRHFADVIATMLKDPAQSNVFVAIGAAHLAGSDSVIEMLQKGGVTVSRIE